jgi:tetratricopeptide (TPR) repeat protein
MELLRSQPDRQPKESWFQLLASIYLQQRNYRAASPVLEQAVSYWPHRLTYYIQLSAVYQEMDRQADAFSILSIAQYNNLLKKESDINRLVQLYRYFDHPYKGAKIYKDAMNRKLIKLNEKNWESVANAWLQAREWRLAEESLKNADRIHAISFGKFYLQAFGNDAQQGDIKEVFQHWNISGKNSFSAQNVDAIEPKILEAAFELAKAMSSKGKKP